MGGGGIIEVGVLGLRLYMCLRLEWEFCEEEEKEKISFKIRGCIFCFFRVLGEKKNYGGRLSVGLRKSGRVFFRFFLVVGKIMFFVYIYLKMKME